MRNGSPAGRRERISTGSSSRSSGSASGGSSLVVSPAPGALATRCTPAAGAPRRSAPGPRSRAPQALLAKATQAAGPPARARTSRRRRDFLREARRRLRPTAASTRRSGWRSSRESYSRRALGRLGVRTRHGDASFIFVEGDVDAPAGGAFELRARAAAAAALRRRLRQGGQDRIGRDHVLRRDALHDPAGLALRGAAGPASAEGSGSQVKMVSGAVNVYTSEVAVDDRPRTTATASIDRNSRVSVDVAPGRKDRGDELPRPDDGFDRPGDRRPRGAASGSSPRRARARSRRGSRLPEAPQPILPADNRIFDLRPATRWTCGGPACPTRCDTGSRSRVRGSSSRTRTRWIWTTAPGLGPRQGLAGRALLLAASRPSTGRAVSSDWSSVRRFRMLEEPVRAGTGDTTPPELSVFPPQQMGNLFLIFGKTERGAVVTVNAEPADVETDGSFKKTDDDRARRLRDAHHQGGGRLRQRDGPSA